MTPELERFVKVLKSAADALRSYQHGNAATELAREVADACDAALADAGVGPAWTGFSPERLRFSVKVDRHDFWVRDRQQQLIAKWRAYADEVKGDLGHAAGYAECANELEGVLSAGAVPQARRWRCPDCGIPNLWDALECVRCRLISPPDKERWEFRPFVRSDRERLSTTTAIEAAGAVPQPNPPCSKCGGPHPFDTSLPSVVWNHVIRGADLPDYLCLTCIVAEFAARGQSFTAQLSSEQFHGLPIEVIIDGREARDAALIQAENNALRARVRELEDR